MAPRWTPEAERLKPNGTPGTLQGGGAKAIAHVTVSPSGGRYFDAMDDVLTDKKGEPHYLIDPWTDRLGQYFPLDVSARATVGGASINGVSNNKAGDRVIQIEFVADVKPVFTSYWRPGPNFRAMMRDIRANGVPSVWAAPRLARSYGDNVRMDAKTWRKAEGWVGHCHAPYPDTHWDPGPIDMGAFLAAQWYQPQGITTTELQTLLNARFGAELDIDGLYGPATEAAVKAAQTRMGVEDADGLWGPSTLAAYEHWTSTGVIIPKPEEGNIMTLTPADLEAIRGVVRAEVDSYEAAHNLANGHRLIPPVEGAPVEERITISAALTRLLSKGDEQ